MNLVLFVKISALVIIASVIAISIITKNSAIGAACGMLFSLVLLLIVCLCGDAGGRFKDVPNEIGIVYDSETMVMYNEHTMNVLYDASGEPLLYEDGEKE